MKSTVKARAGLQLTEEEFYAQEDEDSPYEYLAGALVVREPVSYQHDAITLFLTRLLGNLFEKRGGGKVHGPGYPMRLDPKWSPEPDVMVVLDEHRDRHGPQRLEGPADLAIEIASPGDVRRALRLKLPRYREARVPEIWVIDAYAPAVRVDVLLPSPGGTAYRSRELKAGRLRSVVLPWFWIDVSWLRQRPLPRTLDCMRKILAGRSLRRPAR